MQTPGTYISAVGHIGLIVWLVAGWGMQADPLEFDTMDVQIVSGDEFAALTRQAATPEPGQAAPDAPVPPVVADTPAPEPVSEPAVIPAPAPPPVPPPAPEPSVAAPPAPQSPPVEDVSPEPPVPPAPPPVATDLPPSDTPTPPQADRVASTITAPPPPEADVDDILREEVVPDQTDPAPLPQEEQAPTAPEQTTTEIVIADETPSGAVETSMRPVARPTRPAVQATPPPDPDVAQTTPAQDAVPADTINDVLAGLAPDVPAGPPMTGSERESFRVAVNSCWIVDPGSPAARATVEVGFSLDREGRVAGAVRLEGAEGDSTAVNIAFEAARRAILRCQRTGYVLPADKYDQWKDVVITFDPSGMRLR